MKGFPGLPVKGLVADEARALLESVEAARSTSRYANRIVAETGGKPLMLLEMAHRLAPEELAGGSGVPDALAPSALVEEQFRRQLEPLPAPARSGAAGGGRPNRSCTSSGCGTRSTCSA